MTIVTVELQEWLVFLLDTTQQNVSHEIYCKNWMVFTIFLLQTQELMLESIMATITKLTISILAQNLIGVWQIVLKAAIATNIPTPWE